MTRRELLQTTGTGFGMVGLSHLLQAAPHHTPKAKQVIFLFLNGGPSQVDTFDPKPNLAKFHGQPMPGDYPKAKQERGTLMQSPFKFQRYGQSGLEVSDLFAKTAQHIDDICVLRSMHTDLPAHPQAILQMNSGRIIPGFPSWGSWITYGLGTENKNLPGFITLCAGVPDVGAQLWSSAFLPSVNQGTYVPNDESDPEKMIQHLRARGGTTEEQRKRVELWEKLNKLQLTQSGPDAQLEGRIQSMEVAYRMQSEALDAFDVAKEPLAIRERYGIEATPDTSEMKIKSATRDGDFARGCLVARRLIERGVRAVQVYFGNDKPWDSHHDILVHRRLAHQADQPIAALLSDLKSSGLLKETLVIIGGEFGRRPWTEVAGRINVQNGRNHNNEGFTTLLIGGGVKGGMAYGATDDFGYQAIDKKVHVHDLHATVLHLMGLEHTRLTYPYSGRQFRLTDVAGNVIQEILV
ncbi:DUF1501 domain-containing protein [Bryobacter aggregatus]|uniref:DUF1501 domain-containing protein n=1 Tax=Bryobacter aggregatus TaxID=360054 RepID=UPI0004E236EA|nr:DUF1501 domain-containing protein [Bryobacter aggregatus]